jgi:hypothetical protein
VSAAQRHLCLTVDRGRLGGRPSRRDVMVWLWRALRRLPLAEQTARIDRLAGALAGGSRAAPTGAPTSR